MMIAMKNLILNENQRAVKPVSSSSTNNPEKSKDGGFKTAPDGRLIIADSDNESDDGRISKKQSKILGLDSDASDDYKAGGSGIHRPVKVRKQDKIPGEEYKHKKAFGDVKLKGKPEPYAYIPIRRADLNRSGSFSLTFLDGMTHIYKNVQNVVVKIGPFRSSKHSLLLNCHFDSFVESPGPDHIGIMLSPYHGLRLKKWSILEEKPLQGPKWNDRETYFIYYSCIKDCEPLNFSLELERAPPARAVGGSRTNTSIEARFLFYRCPGCFGCGVFAAAWHPRLQFIIVYLRARVS
ncbi:unnamed protein product [Trichogramma brassicae]|uniref:Endoplasmic reticulum metallopeptidase 1-like C-terminal domain-containing protein n=1 Tax=Trichogramma brassicae TaxID=86971 RepID=A0A6H5IBT3_9HYME|nr:unnamed protein product [Trichogramma brassicae]